MGRASEKSNIARIDTSISKRFIGNSHKKLDIGVGKRGYYYIKPWGSTTGWFELCRLRSCVEYREKFKSHISNLKSQNQAQRSKHQAQSTKLQSPKPKAQSPKPKAQSPTLLLTSPGR